MMSSSAGSWRLRTVSLCASTASALLNLYCAARVLAVCRSLKWDWDNENDVDALRLDAVKLVWALLLSYFIAAAAASAVGFVGIARRKLSFVRFLRDYSIADLVFMSVSALTMCYFSFRSSSMLQATVCEELARQPELMRDMAESGLNLENCEYWFERAVVAVLGALLVFAVARVHFVIALSKYYNQLRREKVYNILPSSSKEQHSLQRIYLLPTPTSSSFPPISFNHHSSHADNSSSRESDGYYYRDDPSDDVLVYAPIPMSRLSLGEAQGMQATEAWISAAPPASSSRVHKHHHHHRHHLHSSGSTRSHRHRNSVSSNLPYKDDGEEPLMVTGEKAV